jgi:hypothetical protein
LRSRSICYEVAHFGVGPKRRIVFAVLNVRLLMKELEAGEVGVECLEEYA